MTATTKTAADLIAAESGESRLTDEQQSALARLRLRLTEWDEHGEGRDTAADFAAASRMVLRAFGLGVPQPTAADVIKRILTTEATAQPENPPSSESYELVDALKASMQVASRKRT